VCRAPSHEEALTIPRKLRTFAQEADYVSSSLPSIERRSLMESGMRPRTTVLDVVIVVVFVLAVLALLGYFVAAT
jgi:hypothetical protein